MGYAIARLGFILAVLVAGEVVVPWIAERGALVLWPVLTVVETGKTPEYRDIQPQSYSHPVPATLETARQAVLTLPRWRIVTADHAAGVLKAEAVTPVFRCVDDITITVEPYDDRSIVYVRSASRIGRTDFGRNARNIRAFFLALDRRLSS